MGVGHTEYNNLNKFLTNSHHLYESFGRCVFMYSTHTQMCKHTYVHTQTQCKHAHGKCMSVVCACLLLLLFIFGDDFRAGMHFFKRHSLIMNGIGLLAAWRASFFNTGCRPRKAPTAAAQRMTRQQSATAPTESRDRCGP